MPRAVRALKEAHPAAPILIGHGDAGMLTDPALNLGAFFGLDVTSPPADRLVAEEDALTFAGIPLEVLEIPGHSPGHVIYLVRGTEPLIVLGGDVLFAGSVGRTDFPGGSFEQLAAGIRAKTTFSSRCVMAAGGRRPAPPPPRKCVWEKLLLMQTLRFKYQFSPTDHDSAPWADVVGAE